MLRIFDASQGGMGNESFRRIFFFKAGEGIFDFPLQDCKKVVGAFDSNPNHARGAMVGEESNALGGQWKGQSSMAGAGECFLHLRNSFDRDIAEKF